MKRTVILSAFAAAFIALSFGYFVWFRPARVQPSVSAEQPANRAAPPANLIAAPGVVEAISEEIEVGAEIAGKLKQVAVEEGDSVIKGQTIAVLENADFAAQAQAARRAIETLRRQEASAEARIAAARADRARIFNGARGEERLEALRAYEQTVPNVEQAGREVERRAKLYESGDIARESFERARRDLEVLQKQSAQIREKYNVVNAAARPDDLRKADAAILLAERQAAEFAALIQEAETRARAADANFEKTVVRAPISGVILRRRLQAGESVTPESATGIVTVADTSALRVRVDLDETDVARVRAGQTAYLTADAFGAQKFAARVVRVGQIMGRKNFRAERPTEKVDTRILEVLLEIEPHQTLPLGLRVDAFIRASE